MEILNIENLTFTYPLSSEPVLKNISFSVNEGDFVVICGATGSGKSTLLRMIKREITPQGERAGRILYCGIEQSELDDVTSACKIGFVMQNPEQQIVTDKVWHELAFGLENMGLKSDTIRRRVAEMACYFGIEDWFEKPVSELSGGQKQLLNLAAVMVMQPKILILDEPTAQLDPIAASDFMNTLHKLNRELSLTIILAEHRLEDAIPACDRLLVLDDGKLLCYDTPKNAVNSFFDNERILTCMPSAVRLFCSLKGQGECPLSVREGRRFIETHYKNDIRANAVIEKAHSTAKALEFSDVYFRYERHSPDVLHGTTFTVYEKEVLCILGGNGSGKTTTLGVAAGLLRHYAGNVKVFGKKISDYKNQSLYKNCIGYLPQDVQTVFLKNTVREELAGCDTSALPYDLSSLYDKHPYDLSGGEQQLVALCKVLSQNPRLLLLDEPTKGLDNYAKAGIIGIIKQLKDSGMTIVCVTHDVEFAALCADRCALFFRGEVTAVNEPHEFFTDNNFYTTAALRMSRGFYDGAITVEELTQLCKANGEKCV